MGESKPGEDTEMKGKTAVVFYQLTRDGEELVYIDVLNTIERIGGVDRMEAHRAALGRF
jgi:P2 family phage contractile tail tube protein